MLENKTQEWLEEVWQKIETKMSWIVDKEVVEFPYTVDENGNFMEAPVDEIRHSWWTNGFYGGMLWLMYQNTKDSRYQVAAQRLETALDEALLDYDGLHHDVGFMWLHTSVANYKITGRDQSRKRGMLAASLLSSRYNINGQFIRAWNEGEGVDRRGWVIIDSMMNIPILEWASRESKDPRFSNIARKHADKVAENFIRADGSVRHICAFDIHNGAFLETFGGQGYEAGSSWTRGQAWAIYGFVLSYRNAGDQKYLEYAKKVGNYFIAALGDDWVPNVDFRCPAEPLYKDTTAGAIAACGLIEIAKAVPEFEKDLYLNAAINILRSIESHYCDWTKENDAIVQYGSESYASGQNIPIIYGTYFFMEAVDKLIHESICMW